MVNTKVLSKQQLQRRAENVYGAIAGVFGKAQLDARSKKNAFKHQKNMVSKAKRITNFTDKSIEAALLQRKGSKKIAIGKAWAKQFPEELTPNLAEEFLHLWKLHTPESKARHFIPHAVHSYLVTKRGSRGPFPFNRNKLQALINSANKVQLVAGFEEKNMIETPLGKMNSYDIGNLVGFYASKLEQKIRLRHSGLFFIALVDSGKTIKQAEQEVAKIAEMRKKQAPRL